MPTAGERRAAAEVLAKAKARTARVTLCLNGELEDQLEAVRDAFENADKDTDSAAELAADLVALEEQIEAASTEFVFQVGRGRWRKLMADHPPTDEQKAVGADFDVDEFPFVAMAEFLVEPALTAEELKQLNEDALDEVKFAHLWGACCRAATGGTPRPSSEAARRLLNARGNSKPASSLELVEVS